jgi:AraC family transcriptional regulator, exoenzyme S synthesis regulatory protein ExsA
MFTLPDDLREYKQSPVYYYLHINNAENNNSKLHFTRSCVSIGINGTKKLQTANGIEIFEQGDLIFYTPGNYLSYQNIDTDQPYKSLMIFFDTLLLADLSRQFDEVTVTKQGHHFSRHYLSLRSNAYISTFCESVRYLCAQEQAFTPALQKIKLLELIAYLKGIFGSSFIPEGERPPGQLSVLQLQKVIEDNRNSYLTLEEIAFMCNMSLATFKRAFGKIYGTSPGKWIREKKLVWAEEQICKFHRSPKEIYREAGYYDYSSFSYAFKQRYGVSPRTRLLEGA